MNNFNYRNLDYIIGISIILLILTASCVKLDHSGEVEVKHDINVDHYVDHNIDIDGQLDIDVMHELTGESAHNVAVDVRDKATIIIGETP